MRFFNNSILPLSFRQGSATFFEADPELSLRLRALSVAIASEAEDRNDRFVFSDFECDDDTIRMIHTAQQQGCDYNQLQGGEIPPEGLDELEMTTLGPPDKHGTRRYTFKSWAASQCVRLLFGQTWKLFGPKYDAWGRCRKEDEFDNVRDNPALIVCGSLHSTSFGDWQQKCGRGLWGGDSKLSFVSSIHAIQHLLEAGFAFTSFCVHGQVKANDLLGFPIEIFKVSSSGDALNFECKYSRTREVEPFSVPFDKKTLRCGKEITDAAPKKRGAW